MQSQVVVKSYVRPSARTVRHVRESDNYRTSTDATRSGMNFGWELCINLELCINPSWGDARVGRSPLELHWSSEPRSAMTAYAAAIPRSPRT